MEPLWFAVLGFLQQLCECGFRGKAGRAVEEDFEMNSGRVLIWLTLISQLRVVCAGGRRLNSRIERAEEGYGGRYNKF